MSPLKKAKASRKVTKQQRILKVLQRIIEHLAQKTRDSSLQLCVRRYTARGHKLRFYALPLDGHIQRLKGRM